MPFPPALVAVKVILEVVAEVRFSVSVPLITPEVELTVKPVGKVDALKLVGVLLPVMV